MSVHSDYWAGYEVGNAESTRGHQTARHFSFRRPFSCFNICFSVSGDFYTMNLNVRRVNIWEQYSVKVQRVLESAHKELTSLMGTNRFNDMIWLAGASYRHRCVKGQLIGLLTIFNTVVAAQEWLSQYKLRVPRADHLSIRRIRRAENILK